MKFGNHDFHKSDWIFNLKVYRHRWRQCVDQQVNTCRKIWDLKVHLPNFLHSHLQIRNQLRSSRQVLGKRCKTDGTARTPLRLRRLSDFSSSADIETRMSKPLSGVHFSYFQIKSCAFFFWDVWAWYDKNPLKALCIDFQIIKEIWPSEISTDIENSTIFNNLIRFDRSHFLANYAKWHSLKITMISSPNTCKFK